MDELEQLCRDQKLRTLPRMGAKLEEKVLRSIMQYKERSGRFLLSFADNTAKELTAWLSGWRGSKRSLRREVCGAAGRPLAIWIFSSRDRMRRRRWNA